MPLSAQAGGWRGPRRWLNIKYLLVGANAVMTTSALLRYGPAYVNTLVEGLKYWMELRSFSSVTQMKGIMSRDRVANPSAFEKEKFSLSLCYGVSQIGKL